MATTKRFYCVRTESGGMGGGTSYVAVLATAPEPAPNLSVVEVPAETPLFDWRVRTPDDTPPAA